MRLTERQVTTTLKHHGYKLTPQRRAVVQAIISSQDHLTPQGIYEKVSREHPNIGLVTVYRTLEILQELELICELHGSGACHSYTMGSSQHHHHLICSKCGVVIDFTGYDITDLERNISKRNKFKITGHLLEFVGLCQDCR